jgi:high-affinity nickel-transport protein
MDRTFGKLGLYQMLRPLVVGIVHGLAGSAAIALLVLTTIRVPGWAMVYLLVFGLGTVAGMMLITAAIAVPFTVSQNRFARMNHFLATASGVISLVFGLLIVSSPAIPPGHRSNSPVRQFL